MALHKCVIQVYRLKERVAQYEADLDTWFEAALSRVESELKMRLKDSCTKEDVAKWVIDHATGECCVFDALYNECERLGPGLTKITLPRVVGVACEYRKLRYNPHYVEALAIIKNYPFSKAGEFPEDFVVWVYSESTGILPYIPPSMRNE